MKITKANHLPSVAGQFDCYMIENCRIRHASVISTDEFGAAEGSEWYFRERRDSATGTFDAYAWVWLRNAAGEIELTEFLLSEQAGLDRANPVFEWKLFRLASWARGEIEERLTDPEFYGIDIAA
ncbi:hypothetical protein [Mesorhizobium sp.]|uniref:hypothetical protein n=1 Tax=Mesorhizobium sp. TaxID=1871066 RepID=UPI000FE929D0|nr:hypothetical protein [Mesorhizobium sp.]RWQ14814.1 MAG: hypothetical protein EOR93_27920 [Mesorhizobium sp.]